MNNMEKMVCIQNEAQCAKCGQIIFSRHRHDFVSCKCRAISVDGGLEYRRYVGDLGSIIDRSMYVTPQVKDQITDAVTTSKETGRNDFGIALAVIRVLRDNNLIDMDKFK